MERRVCSWLNNSKQVRFFFIQTWTPPPYPIPAYPIPSHPNFHQSKQPLSPTAVVCFAMGRRSQAELGLNKLQKPTWSEICSPAEYSVEEPVEYSASRSLSKKFKMKADFLQTGCLQRFPTWHCTHHRSNVP